MLLAKPIWLVMIGRDGKKTTIHPGWHKPAAMIIDGGSRSGKEVIAFAFKKHHVGVLVGERTGGAVLAGTPRPKARILSPSKGCPPIAPTRFNRPGRRSRSASAAAAIPASSWRWPP